MRSRTPSRRAWRIAGSVGSRGSPIPKSTTSSPCERRSAAIWLSRTNGYVACALSVGESTPLTLLAERERAESEVGALERCDLDELVAGVRVPRRARPEVDGSNATGREIGDV